MPETEIRQPGSAFFRLTHVQAEGYRQGMEYRDRYIPSDPCATCCL